MSRVRIQRASFLATLAVLFALPLAHAAPVFDLVNDFSTTQGQNNLSYGFFQTNSFTQPSDFKQMIVNGSDWVPNHDDQSLFPLGPNGVWNQNGPAQTFTTIRQSAPEATLFLHANSNPSYDNALPYSLELPAIKWTDTLTATTSLKISGLIGNVTGSITSHIESELEVNDGFNILFYHNQTLFRAHYVPRGGYWDGEVGTSNRVLVPYSFNVSVNPGDSIYMVQDPLLSQRSDHAYFSAVAEAIVPEPTSLGLLSVVAVVCALAGCRRRRSESR